MHAVSTFFTAYSARRHGTAVEAIAAVVSEGPDLDPIVRFIVVDDQGRAILVDATEVDLNGVNEQYDEDDPAK